MTTKKSNIFKKLKYKTTCPNCGQVNRVMVKRKGKVACSACCNAYNDGKYHEDYQLIYEKNE